jgi:DNA-binding transcriptional LysR family regulator
VQALFRDRFLGFAREGHPLFDAKITAARYAGFGHVVTSRQGKPIGPADDALAALGLARPVVSMVPSFPAALAIVCRSDLLSLAPESFLRAVAEFRGGFRSFPLPVKTEAITVSLMWHPRMDADPGHRWLRRLIQELCRA